MSKSSMPTRRGALVYLFFRKDNAKARFTGLSSVRNQEMSTGKLKLLAMVLFPTPPFPLATAKTFWTFAMGLLLMDPPFRGISGGK